MSITRPGPPDDASWTARVSRVGAVKALHAGIDTRDAGLPVSICPFDVNGSLTEQFLAYWWIKGWRRRGVTLTGTQSPE